MDSESLRSLYRDGLAAVRRYLTDQLGPLSLRDSEDFDRDGLVLQPSKSDQFSFRLFISHEFFSDFSPEDAEARLRAWRVADKLRTLSDSQTLVVTTDGTFTERTELESPDLGRSLAESVELTQAILPASKSLQELYARVFAIRVDGQEIGRVPAEMRGDPELHSMYTERFAEAVGAVYLLDAAGYRNFELYSRSRPPDFKVCLDNTEVVYLEFKRALGVAEKRQANARDDINAELRRALRDDPVVSHVVEGYFVQIDMSQVPSSAAERNAAVREILKYVNTLASKARERRFVPFDSNEYPSLARLRAAAYVSPGPTSLSVQEGAKTFDPYSPYYRAADIVRRSRTMHFDVAPVWLGISFADSAAIMPPEELLDPRRIPEINVEPTPFDKIIIGTAGSARSIDRRPQ
jgi:hypothetical protein